MPASWLSKIKINSHPLTKQTKGRYVNIYIYIHIYRPTHRLRLPKMYSFCTHLENTLTFRLSREAANLLFGLGVHVNFPSLKKREATAIHGGDQKDFRKHHYCRYVGWRPKRYPHHTLPTSLAEKQCGCLHPLHEPLQENCWRQCGSQTHSPP